MQTQGNNYHQKTLEIFLNYNANIIIFNNSQFEARTVFSTSLRNICNYEAKYDQIICDTFDNTCNVCDYIRDICANIGGSG